MSDTPSSDIVFSDSVKAAQTRLGSREMFQKLESKGGFMSDVTEDIAKFIAQRDSFYLASASAAGQPYIQHRGGPTGFLKVLDPKTLGFADFGGNRQYVTLGNLAENDRVQLFFMDYANRRRLKIWGRARMIEPGAVDYDTHIPVLADPAYDAPPERAILITVGAIDANCPRHIPPLYTEDQVARAISKLNTRIEELEAEIKRLGGG